jgi:hypothetical protein
MVVGGIVVGGAVVGGTVVGDAVVDVVVGGIVVTVLAVVEALGLLHAATTKARLPRIHTGRCTRWRPTLWSTHLATLLPVVFGRDVTPVLLPSAAGARREAG